MKREVVIPTQYNLTGAHYVSTDLDSIASSIAFAWIQSEVHKKPTIPLIQMHRDDLTLRPENIHALSLAGLESPVSQLLTLTDLSSFTPFPSTSFALVDHNRLGPSYASNPSAEVVAVIDHHDDENLHPTASPRTISPCGSCASHLALLCPSEVPSELATLLLTAILIDTAGLKPGGKALKTDVDAAAFLVPLSLYAQSLSPKVASNLFNTQTVAEQWAKTGQGLYQAPAIRDLTKSLLTKKEDVTLLNSRDLLRRDYKEYTYVLPGAGNRSIKAGLSSVPVSLEVMAKEGKLEGAMVAWMKERGITVFGVLTSFRGGSDGKGNHKREMAWLVYGAAEKADGETSPTSDHDAAGPEAGTEGVDFEKLAQKLWKGLQDSADIKVKKHKKISLEKGEKLPSGANGMVYKQGNVKATRKVTAPLLQSILEDPESLENKK